jgi:S-adenosylmethionine decarboxylase
MNADQIRVHLRKICGLNLFPHCLILSRNCGRTMTLGTEWLIDASGCNPEALANLDRLRAVFDRVIRDLDLHVLGEIAWHQFDHPNGVSGLALLSESHLSCHTYPEFRAATFNLYCCRNVSAWPWETTLKEMLGATEVHVRVFERVIHEDAHALAGVAK